VGEENFLDAVEARGRKRHGGIGKGGEKAEKRNRGAWQSENVVRKEAQN